MARLYHRLKVSAVALSVAPGLLDILSGLWYYVSYERATAEKYG
jgi:hypothetical protein